jgi:hypothetical protein
MTADSGSRASGAHFMPASLADSQAREACEMRHRVEAYRMCTPGTWRGHRAPVSWPGDTGSPNQLLAAVRTFHLPSSRCQRDLRC